MLRSSQRYYILFLDEKWFYPHSRRKKMKVLPKAPFETEEDAKYKSPKTQSCRHPVKVMFLGVVSPPDSLEDADGKVMIRRVSKKTQSKAVSVSRSFVPDFNTNDLIKKGEWHQFFSDSADMSINEAMDIICRHYGVDESTAENMYFTYTTHDARQKKNVTVWLDGPRNLSLTNGRSIYSESGQHRPLLISDINLMVKKPKGTTVERDINCDSGFMLSVIREIGTAVCNTYHYLDSFVPIYLFMDNAGGHGTKAAKQEYTEILKQEFNIIVEWQPPSSPELNLLDLGIWMALQSVVEKTHRGKLVNRDLLAETVYEAFGSMEESVLRNVYQRWLTVLDLVIEGEGSNDMVDQNRRMLRRNPMDDSEDNDLEEIVALIDQLNLSCNGGV